MIGEDGKAQRKSLTAAKQLLEEAGYANGIDPKTQVRLYYYILTLRRRR